MATRARTWGNLDDAIDILKRDAAEPFPSLREVFGTVSAILALVRVGVFVLHPFVNPTDDPTRTT